jgi:anti-anti-sigma factor
MAQAIASREEKKAFIQPAGDVVASSVGDLRDLMREMIAGGVDDMVVDLANTRMVDSRGIGLLIAAHNSLRKVGGRLAVTHASKEILDLFRTMRIHQHFGVSGD